MIDRHSAEVNNLIGNRLKKPRLEGRSFMVPDSILVGARDRNAVESSLSEEQMVRCKAGGVLKQLYNELNSASELTTFLVHEINRRMARKRL